MIVDGFGLDGRRVPADPQRECGGRHQCGNHRGPEPVASHRAPYSMDRTQGPRDRRAPGTKSLEVREKLLCRWVAIGRVERHRALGDREAFAALYRATSAKLFGVCLRVLNSRAEAEDALQEIYVKIWRNADRYKAGGYSPMTWLITLARNLAIDRLRARKQPAHSIDEVHDLADAGATPEAAAIDRSERAQIDLCLDELDSTHALSVRGAYLDGHTYQVLAQHAGVPVNTMRTWLRRSLARLKDCLTR